MVSLQTDFINQLLRSLTIKKINKKTLSAHELPQFLGRASSALRSEFIPFQCIRKGKQQRRSEILDSSFVFFMFGKPHLSVFAKHEEKSLIIRRFSAHEWPQFLARASSVPRSNFENLFFFSSSNLCTHLLILVVSSNSCCQITVHKTEVSVRAL
jgi:hypothetical protein